MSSLLRELQKATGIRTTIQTMSGKKLSTTSLRAHLQSLTKEQPDILLFYYSGHGLQSQSTPWPSLYFSPHKESYPAEKICSLFEERDPRLAILLFDCCNTTYLPSSLLQPKQASTTFSIAGPGLCSLFLKTRGTIVATGAQPGSPSYAGQQGSLFTLALLEAFQRLAPDTAASWDQLLEQTALFCTPYQRPFSLIRVS